MPLSAKADDRGALIPIELGELPFSPRRVFAVTAVSPGTTRGGHAHEQGQQLLVCLAGAVRVELRSSAGSQALLLDSPNRGLLIEAGVWASQTYEEEGTVLLVLASETYEDVSYLPEPSPAG